MENATYSISEAAGLLNLSPKTIRRYIKSGKLPSTKVPTKFGDEYRITEIPDDLKQEAAAQAEAMSKVDVVSPSLQEQRSVLDAQLLYQENIRLAAQLGAATERIRQLEENLKLLEAPKQPQIQTPAPVINSSSAQTSAFTAADQTNIQSAAGEKSPAPDAPGFRTSPVEKEEAGRPAAASPPVKLPWWKRVLGLKA